MLDLRQRIGSTERPLFMASFKELKRWMGTGQVAKKLGYSRQGTINLAEEGRFVLLRPVRAGFMTPIALICSRRGSRRVRADDMRVILYSRVSTRGQAERGYSLRQQLDALQTYAKKNGYDVLAEIEDDGYSGITLDRPGLDRVR